MDDDERPLLHEPDLMLAILRLAERGEATPDACVGHLLALLEQARETAPVDRDELRERISEAAGKLARAHLIEAISDGRFQITARGSEMLAQHPEGIDESLLAQFAEYWSAAGPEAEPAPPLPPEYEAGYAACRAGQSLADNPHPADSQAHLDWENGWCQARDDALEHAG